MCDSMPGSDSGRGWTRTATDDGAAHGAVRHLRVLVAVSKAPNLAAGGAPTRGLWIHGRQQNPSDRHEVAGRRLECLGWRGLLRPLRRPLGGAAVECVCVGGPCEGERLMLVVVHGAGI